MGQNFGNTVLAEICAKFQTTQTFTAAYQPASNGLEERANRKLLDINRPLVNNLHDNWKDWLPQIAASINSSVNDSTGKSPHFIIYGVEKRLPYDLLTSAAQPIYNIDDHAKQQVHMFSTIHASVREKLKATKTEMIPKQHKRAIPVNIKEGDAIMIQQPERASKLAPKFMGPYEVFRYIYGNKFEVRHPNTGVTLVVHSDRLKLMPSPNSSTSNSIVSVENPNEIIRGSAKSYSRTYNLRPRI